MDIQTIFSALQRDHERLLALLEKLADRTSGVQETKTQLLDELGKLLAAHGYTAAECIHEPIAEDEAAHRWELDGEEEHLGAEQLLTRLKATTMGGAPWHEWLTILRDLVELRIEEEREMITRAGDISRGPRLVDLAAAFGKLTGRATPAAEAARAG